MRITGGRLRGRLLHSAGGPDLRPSMDATREAVFQSLSGITEIQNTVVTDMFCGGGAYGFEALSRGARYCLFIDNSVIAIRTVLLNARTLDCSGHCKVIKKQIPEKLVMEIEYQWPDDGQKLSLVIVDPPYKSLLCNATLRFISLSPHFAAGTTIAVFEHGDTETLILPSSATLHKQIVRGETVIDIVQLPALH